MSDKIFILTSGDEGVQFNEGVRLSVLGGGYKVWGFDHFIVDLKKVFDNLYIASTAHNEWIKYILSLNTWDEVDSMAQQHTAGIGEKYGLKYAGFVDFSCPISLTEGIKGHMVRPKGIHVANKITFTVGGGESRFDLSSFQLSADWLYIEEDLSFIKTFLQKQIDFYKRFISDENFKLFIDDGAEFLSQEEKQNNIEKLKSIFNFN